MSADVCARARASFIFAAATIARLPDRRHSNRHHRRHAQFKCFQSELFALSASSIIVPVHSPFRHTQFTQ